MLEPFNFPGHGAGADLESAANMEQAGREGRETALRGALIGEQWTEHTLLMRVVKLNTAAAAFNQLISQAKPDL